MADKMDMTLEVSISDELRHLLRHGLQAARSAGMALQTGTSDAGPPADTVSDAGPVAAAPAASIAPVWRQIKLRRDGHRPMCFEGLPVVSYTTPQTQTARTGAQALSIYVAKDGDVHAALRIDPPDGAAARPMHRCLTVQDAASFAAFIRTADPLPCFAVETGGRGPVQRAATETATAMVQSLTTLTAHRLFPGILST